MTRKEDFGVKVQRVRDLISEKKLDAVVIQSQANFTWLTGARSFIGLASVVACATVIVDLKDVTVVVNSIEHLRIAEEELKPLSEVIEIKSFPWYDDKSQEAILNKLLGGKKHVADGALAAEFTTIRAELTEYEADSYRKTGVETAGILEDVIKSLAKGVTEFEVAGMLSNKYWAAGIEPITMLIAFDKRLRYKHPLPANNSLVDFGMLSVCTRREGLVVSATRHVAVGDVLPEIEKIYNNVAGLEVFLMENSKPGKNIGELFSELQGEYKEIGYEDEWQMHHQGGTAGYLARDIRAYTNTTANIVNNHALAWNPSIKGIKLEETLIAKETGAEVITHTGKFIYKTINMYGKEFLIPDIIRV